jgi:hypothetical protein
MPGVPFDCREHRKPPSKQEAFRHLTPVQERGKVKYFTVSQYLSTRSRAQHRLHLKARSPVLRLAAPDQAAARERRNHSSEIFKWVRMPMRKNITSITSRAAFSDAVDGSAILIDLKETHSQIASIPARGRRVTLKSSGSYFASHRSRRNLDLRKWPRADIANDRGPSFRQAESRCIDPDLVIFNPCRMDPQSSARPTGRNIAVKKVE